nr:MAG TPA: hypothetical protein [Caudoviricetes sp.]
MTGSCCGESKASTASKRTVIRPHRASQRRAEKRRLNIKNPPFRQLTGIGGFFLLTHVGKVQGYTGQRALP